VGEFLDEHCIAAHQQIGNFEVTNVNGRVQKNGGNVVSYFLTPEGRVIDAVVGPANGDKLLGEAQWSQRLFEQIARLPRQPTSAATELVRQAHVAQSNDRVHAYLAENPLATLDQIYRQVFEDLANQKVAQGHEEAQAAAAAFQQARGSGRPVLLVLFKGNDGQPDGATAQLLARLASNAAARPAKSCLVVTLPIDELPALSNLADVPAYDLAERVTPTMVLARPNGEQIAAIRAAVDASELAGQLWSALDEARFDRAQELLEAGEMRLAATYLGWVKSSPTKGPLKQLAKAQWEQLWAGEPVEPTTAAAAAKPAISASAILER